MWGIQSSSYTRIINKRFIAYATVLYTKRTGMALNVITWGNNNLMLTLFTKFCFHNNNK